MIHHDQPASQMDCVVVSPDEVIFEGKVTKLIVPGLKQELSILPDHTPLYAQLKTGQIQIFPVSSSSETMNIESGIIRVRSNQISIITGFDVKGEILGSEKLK